jgi:Family of unknown function (DUF5996)
MAGSLDGRRRAIRVRPGWLSGLVTGEFILPYDKVRNAADPDQLILEFYRTAYGAGATLAAWHRARLERASSSFSICFAGYLAIDWRIDWRMR